MLGMTGKRPKSGQYGSGYKYLGSKESASRDRLLVYAVFSQYGGVWGWLLLQVFGLMTLPHAVNDPVWGRGLLWCDCKGKVRLRAINQGSNHHGAGAFGKARFYIGHEKFVLVIIVMAAMLIFHIMVLQHDCWNEVVAWYLIGIGLTYKIVQYLSDSSWFYIFCCWLCLGKEVTLILK